MTVADRLMEFAKDNRLKNKDFDILVGKSVGYLGTLVAQGSMPSVEVLTKVKEAYPDWNIEWFLTGKGEKRRAAQVAEEQEPYGLRPTIDAMIDKKISKAVDRMRAEIMAELKNQAKK